MAALAADRAKTRFLMNMSHELRTPPNAILGYTELIAENVAAGETGGIEHDLRAIHRAGVRLLRSVSSILELTRLEAEARAARLARVEVAPLLRELEAQFAAIAAERGNMIEVTCPEGLPSLTTDAHMLRYNLTTLLDNACRFTHGGRIAVRAHRVEREGRPWLEFEVADSGVGIEAEALPAIFDAFTQADDSTTRRFEGTGVSLAVAQRFCALLGGEIRVASQAGAGATFTMALPLDAGHWTRRAAAAPN
jgi:signal transduction histidine kinase